jgi:hypothetical protein
LASAAAFVAVAAAVIGTNALRDNAPASQSPGESSAASIGASVSASPTSSPIAERWTDLVWEATDPAPFARAGSTSMTDGVADGDGFLAIGFAGQDQGKSRLVWRSPDGRAWTAIDSDLPATAYLERVLNFGTGFIVISRQEAPDPTTGQGSSRDRIWWSEDGVEWVERTPEASDGLYVTGVAAGPSGVLIRAFDLLSNEEYWLLSDDQLNWTRTDAQLQDHIGVWGVASSGAGWLAYGVTGADGASTTGAIWTSADAKSWAPARIEDPGESINDIRWIGGRLVALGSQQGLRCQGCFGRTVFGLHLVTWVSSDGREWQRASEREVGSIPVENDHGKQGRVAAGGNRILAFEAGEDGSRLAAWQSVDGFAWSEVRVRNGQPSSVAWLAGLVDFETPFIVGPHGLVAFGHDIAGTSVLPMYAEGVSSARLDLPTFAPWPTPSGP